MDKTAIKKVVLEVEGKEITLTVEGAKKLKDLLSELFGKEIIREVRVENHYKQYPIYWQYTAPSYDKWNQVYCRAGESSTVKATFDNNTLALAVS